MYFDSNHIFLKGILCRNFMPWTPALLDWFRHFLDSTSNIIPPEKRNEYEQFIFYIKKYFLRSDSPFGYKNFEWFQNKILERKRRLLSKVDNFSKLNDEERKMGLLSYMQFLGEEFETPNQSEVSDIEFISHDLIEENLMNDSFSFSDSE